MSVLDRAGVTLIELTVVLVILGIAAGIAAFGGMQEGRARGSRPQRADSLRWAAIETGRAVLDTTDSADALYLPDGRIVRERP